MTPSNVPFCLTEKSKTKMTKNRKVANFHISGIKDSILRIKLTIRNLLQAALHLYSVQNPPSLHRLKLRLREQPETVRLLATPKHGTFCYKHLPASVVDRLVRFTRQMEHLHACGTWWVLITDAGTKY